MRIIPLQSVNIPEQRTDAFEYYYKRNNRYYFRNQLTGEKISFALPNEANFKRGNLYNIHIKPNFRTPYYTHANEGGTITLNMGFNPNVKES